MNCRETDRFALEIAKKIANQNKMNKKYDGKYINERHLGLYW